MLVISECEMPSITLRESPITPLTRFLKSVVTAFEPIPFSPLNPL